MDWKTQEKDVAVKMGGRVTPGSGSTWKAKGDVSTPDWLIECKLTDKRSYSLKRDVLDKIWLEALAENRDAALFVSIAGKSFVVLDEDTFLTLARYYAEYN